MNSTELIRIGTKILQKSIKFNAELDSELILSNVLKTTREKLIIYPKKNINKASENKFNSYIKERKLKKPVAYILGYKEFWKQKFVINPSVLIPRPDTELIIEKVLKNYKKNENKNILDIGTGSGCIILSILLERKKFRGVGIDLSKQAINVAKINAKMQQFGNRIRFINTDIDNFFSNKYDLIVSNPPYIKKSKLSGLIEDVRNFEPKLALDGGLDGYSTVLKVIAKSSKLLRKNGIMFLEIDRAQVIRTKEMLIKYKFYTKDVCKDLSGNNRCIIAIKL
tara:strand:+ start:654 stop:1496 length:843 start_codon:yes stop_codon:yes gene_type:complete